MVKKVCNNENFIFDYKKDIKDTSELLKRFSGNKELKESMVDALLSVPKLLVMIMKMNANQTRSPTIC